MKTKTAGLVLSAVFLGVALGVGLIREQKKNSAARQQVFMDCFTTAQETDYPSRTTPEQRANAQKKAEEIAKAAYAWAGIKLTDGQTQTTAARLVDSQIIIQHCAGKTGVQIEERWTTGAQPLPTWR